MFSCFLEPGGVSHVFVFSRVPHAFAVAKIPVAWLLPPLPPQKRARVWLRKRNLEKEKAATKIQVAVRRRQKQKQRLEGERQQAAREEAVSTSSPRGPYWRDRS